MSENKITFLQNQLGLARREIHNLRQQVSTLTYVHQKEIESIHSKLENWECQQCKRKQVSENLSGGGATAKSNNEYEFRSIGTISTHFPEKRGTPRQPGICKDTIAKLSLNKDIFTNPFHALEGLQEFSHMWILFHFHKNNSAHCKAKVAPPRLNGIRTGVFATRSPHRPCAIGLSLVKIDRIMDNIIYFSGVDMVDQTPVFDIKPYIPQYDNPGMFNVFDIVENVVETSDNVTESNNEFRGHSLNEQNFGLNASQMSNSVNPQQSSVTIEESLTSRELDGQENEREHQILEVPGSNEPGNEVIFHRRSSSRMGEREAPDGEEEEPASASAQRNTSPLLPSTSGGQIRVPSWINQAPVSRLSVTFKDRALAQLGELGLEAEKKKNIITNVLQEDPRSVYLRERWGSHCYVFRIADLYVSCKFNDNSHSVTVYQIFQNERQNNDDESNT